MILPSVAEFEDTDEVKGNMRSSLDDDRLMRSVLDCDADAIDKGKLLNDAISQNVSSFVPDKMFENLVNDYSLAKQIYGEGLIRFLTGYDPSYIEKNINIPEFKRLIAQNIDDGLDDLRKQKLIDKNNEITDKGIALATVVMYVKELDNMVSKGFVGEKSNKNVSHHGSKDEVKNFKNDRYKDIAIRQTIKRSVRRGHDSIYREDLIAFKKKSKGKVYVIYAIDSSGSMKGKKIAAAKNAGVALAYKALEAKDKVGVITFDKEIKTALNPTSDFERIIGVLAKIRPGNETDLVQTIRKSIDMFPLGDFTRHLIILTDAMPTAGNNPNEDTLDAVKLASKSGITVSVIGITLDRDAQKLATEMVEIGKGKLSVINDIENIDRIVLEDYFSL